MKMFKMPESELNRILQYLVTKPYGEVWQFIDMLKKAEEIAAEEVINNDN